jgi:hypothetical protein
MYRCEWGAGFATTPTMMSATRVRCASYLHAAPAERRLQLSLNTIDYTPLAPSFGYGRTFRLPVCPSASPFVCPFAPQPHLSFARLPLSPLAFTLALASSLTRTRTRTLAITLTLSTDH